MGLENLAGTTRLDIAQLPLLGLVVERLARLMAGSFRGLTTDAAEVSVDLPTVREVGEFIAASPPGCMVAVIRMPPWDGFCLAAIDPPLIAAAIELLLGGRRNATRGEAAADEPRRYTGIERAVVERLAAELVAGNLDRAFAPVGEVTSMLDRLDADFAAAGSLKPAEPAITFHASFAIDGHRGGIGFLIPYAMLKPLRDRLAQATVEDAPAADAAWYDHLLTELPQARVMLRAVIERRRISSAEVMRWRIGSVLELNRRHDQPVELFCNDLLVLRARMAERAGHMALFVEDRLLAEDWPPPQTSDLRSSSPC